MKLKLVAAISALAIPALAHAQQSGPQLHVPKPTKADAQNVVQIITSDNENAGLLRFNRARRSGQSGSAKRYQDGRDAHQTSRSADRQARSRVLQIDGRIGASRSEIQ